MADAAQAHRDAIHDRVMAVEKAMTEDQREAFLGAFVRINPQLNGIHVADALDMLYDCDAHLDITEPLFEDHEADLARRGYVPGLLSMCAYAVLYSCGTLQGPVAFRQKYWPDIEALLIKATNLFNATHGPRH